MSSHSVELGTAPLSLADIIAVAQGAAVTLSPSAAERMRQARVLVDNKAKLDAPVYGVTTGFGALAEVKIPTEQLLSLQRNLILSHCAGVGRALSRFETRAMMALRAQTLAQGYSGARVEVLSLLMDMLNAQVHPIIPEKGSVGASGDLAPLAHLALGLIGEGRCEYQGKIIASQAALSAAGLSPIVLQAKEGLALINGTQAMAALGTLNVTYAKHLAQLADIAGALTLEGLSGIPAAFDARIHAIRPHPGQIASATNLRALIAGSGLHSLVSKRTQDAYSLRCMPQVHGATHDTLAYVASVLEREINSATDNPLVFTDSDEIISGGNFHGQPLALSLDFAAIAVAELANISERRVEQMLNPSLSGLPAFLVPESGIQSGYMIAQLTAASLVNENKILASPASVDSIPGSACREDHVSMGMTSARKLREIAGNVSVCLGIELLCAAQAVDLGRGPASLGKGTRVAYDTIRQHIPTLTEDRLLSTDLETITELVKGGTILAAVQKALGNSLL